MSENSPPAIRRVGFARRMVSLRPTAAIWPALVLLLVVSIVLAPDSLTKSSFVSVLPFFGFLAIAACGQLLVVMTAGIDLSVPAVITMAGVVTLKVSEGRNDHLAEAIITVLIAAALIGVLNGVLVALLRIPSLITTLSVGGLVTGATLWYQGHIQAESSVPKALSDFGSAKVFGAEYLSTILVIAIVVGVALTVGLKMTKTGRRFTAVGANPRAAWASGVNPRRYVVGAYALAGLLYGITGILLAAFVRNPGTDLGDPYLLTTVVAVVLSGASLSGGVGFPIAVLGGSLFVVQLEQVLKVQGSATGIQLILQGLVIVAAMALRGGTLAALGNRVRSDHRRLA